MNIWYQLGVLACDFYISEQEEDNLNYKNTEISKISQYFKFEGVERLHMY